MCWQTNGRAMPKGRRREDAKLIRVTGVWRAKHIRGVHSTKEARQIARENSLGKCIQYIRDFTLRYATTGLLIWKRDEEQTDDECNLDYFMDEVIIAGDPEWVTQQLLDLREQIGAFGTLVAVAQDWDTREQSGQEFRTVCQGGCARV